MGMDDVKQTYFGDHFEVHTGIKSLCCIPATNTVLQVNNTSRKKYRCLEATMVKCSNPILSYIT